SAGEAYGVWRSSELSVKDRTGHASFLRRHDGLARQPGRAQATLVEHKGQAFAMTQVSEDDVCQQERPSASESLHSRQEGLRIGPDLLDRNHVEPRKRLRDTEHVAEIAQGGLTGNRAPLRRQPVEGPNVPGPDE